MKHTIRSTVDFPAALAPVNRSMLAESPPSFTSFGIKSFTAVTIHGCRSSSNSMMLLSSSTNTGRQLGVPRLAEARARLTRQSSWATILTAPSQIGYFSSNRAKNRPATLLTIWPWVSCASCKARTSFRNSGK